MRTRSLVVLSLVSVPMLACSQPPAGALPECVWCGLMDAPEGDLPHTLTIAGEDEPGERIVLRGRVFEADGVTLSANTLLYAYHTDETGIYRTEGEDVSGNGHRHGVLRGWLRTDAEGRYEIRTIKPGVYPTRTEPAHIHLTLTPEGGEEDWVTSFHFAGDKLLSDAQIRSSREAGRFGDVVELRRNDRGVLVGERDLRFRR